MDMRRISEIWIYPIKSLAGVRLNTAVVKQKGLQYDRRWMLVDRDGRFLTQREHPKMALFNVAMTNDYLIVSPLGTTTNTINQSIRVELNKEVSGPFSTVVIWDDEVEAVEVNAEYSAWFSKQLDIECRLVFFPEGSRRDADPDYVKNNEQVSLADGYPFLIIGQSSIDELNRKLKEQVSIKRVRPNFVFSGGLPHEEDSWRNFMIGSVNFEGVKPCARCILITVNPDTGEGGIEPLKELATYRKKNNKIYFGENLIARSYGSVSEGDVIEVIDLKN
jgi:uncharacterized protein YcbX